MRELRPFHRPSSLEPGHRRELPNRAGEDGPQMATNPAVDVFDLHKRLSGRGKDLTATLYRDSIDA